MWREIVLLSLLFFNIILYSKGNEIKKYNIKQTAGCCHLIDNSTDLMNCIDSIEPDESSDNMSNCCI